VSVLVYLMSLPLAVWALAALFSLIDDNDAAAAVVRISTRCLAVLAFMFLVGPYGRAPVLWAFLTVIVLHLSFFGLSRWLIIHHGFNVKRID
jgi:predicted permease